MCDIPTIALLTFGASCVIVGFGIGFVSVALAYAFVRPRVSRS